MKDLGRLRIPEDSQSRWRRRSRFRSSIAQCRAGQVCEEISSTVANAAKRLLKQAMVTLRISFSFFFPTGIAIGSRGIRAGF
jgi:hypothetical protein